MRAARWLALALWALHSVPAWAAPLRVVVRVTDATAEAMLARIRGQTSDLPVELIPLEGEAEAALADQVDGAGQLADRHRAAAVVWFTRVSCAQASAGQVPAPVTGILVQISQPARRTLLVHSTGSLGCEQAVHALPSHALEEAAIAVRRTLTGLLEGGNIGVQVVPPPDTVVKAAPGAAPVEAWRARLLVAAGWLLIADGATKMGQQGLEAGAALESGRLLVGLRLASTFPAEIADELATVSLSRGDASLSLGGRFSLGDRLVLRPAVHVGLALLSRTTIGHGADVVAAPPSRILSPLVSPELRLHVPVHRAAGLGVALGLGVDCLPALPRLVYLREGEQQARPSPAVLQPRLILAIELLR